MLPVVYNISVSVNIISTDATLTSLLIKGKGKGSSLTWVSQSRQTQPSIPLGLINEQ